MYAVGIVATIEDTTIFSSCIEITEHLFEYFSVNVLVMYVGIFIVGKISVR